MPTQERQSVLRRTVKISTIEGSFAQAFLSLATPGSVFLTKFAVLLQATPFHFSVLAAIGQLGQVFQLFGVAIGRRMTSRRPAVVALSAAGRALPLLFAFLPFLFPPAVAIWLFLGFAFLSTALMAASANLWVAWISDMIPLSIRGRFFSRRSQYTVVVGLLCGYLFGAFIDLFSPQPGLLGGWLRTVLPFGAVLREENLPYALGTVFCVGIALGLTGVGVLARQPERPKTVEREPFWSLVAEPLRDGNFRRLLLYGLWWMLAIGIASPFWSPFMIQKLGMSMVSIQVYGTISTTATLLALRPWGILIDRFGNKTAMRLALVLGGLNPLLWVFVTPQHYEILFLEAATSGIMWSGAGIVATNLVLAIAPDHRRQVYSGVFGAFSGLAMMATMLLSGLFLPPALNLAGRHLEPEQVLFGLTALARWSTEVPLSWVHEPRARPVRQVLDYLAKAARARLAALGQRLRRG